MKLFIFITGLALASARVTFEKITQDYHNDIGIPEASRIKNAEAAQDFDGSRIVGGQPSSLGAHPFSAGLLVTLAAGFTSVCGASLLSNTRLVTAAHCWRTNVHQGVSMTVVLGSINLFSGGTRLNTNSVDLHASYNTNNLNNDVAIIVIPWVGYSNTINKVELPSGLLLSFTFANEIAVATGFGRTADSSAGDNNQLLRQVSLRVIQNFECVNIYGTSVVINSVICTAGTGGTGICSGDSGGPLVWTFSGVRYLIGVSSFVAQAGCQIGLPSGYARATSFTSWMQARL